MRTKSILNFLSFFFSDSDDKTPGIDIMVLFPGLKLENKFKFLKFLNCI